MSEKTIVPEIVEKSKGGRPSSYKPEYCEEILEFFNVEPYVEKIVHRFKKNGDCEQFIQKVPNDLPTFEGFCKRIGICKDTLYSWIKIHEEFTDAYKKCKEMQKSILISNGLAGNYHPAFAIFAAKNLIGWTDKKEVEHSGTVQHKKLEEFFGAEQKPVLTDNNNGEVKKLVDFQSKKQGQG